MDSGQNAETAGLGFGTGTHLTDIRITAGASADKARGYPLWDVI